MFFDLMKQFNDLEVNGSSNGLFCMRSEDKDMLVVWNPSIRKFLHIELPYFPGINDFLGFVVSPIKNDPTIVMITYPWNVGIFTLSSKRFTVFQYTKLPPKAVRPIYVRILFVGHGFTCRKLLKPAQHLLENPEDDETQANEDQNGNTKEKIRSYTSHYKLQEGKLAPPELPKFEDPVATKPPVEEKKEASGLVVVGCGWQWRTKVVGRQPRWWFVANGGGSSARVIVRAGAGGGQWRLRLWVDVEDDDDGC
ncbi:hypothetical protein Tco_0890376 [Tanacetum coccineum]|uniref:F-box associated domain-containing protein n=1 Tax=Tanacetum coccineum TaxID=301880 RepID=A0ABQ5C5T7_9ASTR